MQGEMPRLRTRGTGTTWKTDCNVEFEDEPGVRMRKTDLTKELLKYEADYWGVIIDTCQNDIVVDWARMRIKFKSKGGAFEWDAEWDGDLTKEPVTFQKIAIHDDVPVERKEKPTQHRGIGPPPPELPPPHQWLK